MANVPLHTIHRRMTKARVSCLECHGGVRPPVDVVAGPPVGSATVVCDLCHTNMSPAVFASRGAELHREHSEQHLDCGSCHADANLHDDVLPMLPADDGRRARLDRSGTNECAHCHGSVSASSRQVHDEHVGEGTQWCFNCHEGTDPRPLGQSPPVATPAQSCQLCHGTRSYTDDFPFAVHFQHAGQKCASCHQGTPPLSAWPLRWQRQPAAFRTFGAGCTGANQLQPAIGNVGVPRLGRSFTVTLEHGPANALTSLLLGFDAMVLPLDTEGMTGCTLYVRPLASVLYLTSATGSAAHQLPIPNVPALIGEQLCLQWMLADAAANPRGITMSDLARATPGR
jgi:hypothetical protein